MVENSYLKLFAIVFLSCIFQSAYAQNSVIDSLKNELSIAAEDTNKVLLLNTLAYQLHIPNPNEGVKYAIQSIELASKLGFDRGRAHAYNSLGAGYWNMSDLDSALKYYTKSYELNDTLGNARGVTGALSNIAIIYEDRGQYAEAIEAYTSALQEMRKYAFESYVAITSNNLGMVLRRVGKYPEAMSYFRESVKLGEKLNMTNLLGPAWINIGNIYSDTNEPDKELKAKETALKIGTDADNKSVMAMALNNLGQFFKKRGDFEEAGNYYRRALEINTKVGKKRGITANLINIGGVKRELKEFDSSLYYLGKALLLADEIGYKAGSARAYFLYGLTIKETSDKQLALVKFNKAFELAVEANSLGIIEEVSEVLYRSYVELEEFERAFYFQNEHMKVKDSLVNEENIKELAKVEAQYEFENQISAKQSEINLLETSKKITELRVLAGLIASLLVIGSIAFIATSMIRRRNRRNEELQSVNKFKEAMTGMIAHDLKNPLSIIMNSKEAKSSKEMASQMLQLVNNMLDVHRFESDQVKLNRSNVLVEELVTRSRNQVKYLLTERNLKIKSEVEDAIIFADMDIMVRVLVNLLTNAIKYAPLNSEITIASKIENSQLLLSVEDRGEGIAEEQIDTIFESFAQVAPKSSGGVGSTGLGLTFVKLAVEAHGFVVSVKSKTGEGATFTIAAPLTDGETEIPKEDQGEAHIRLSLEEKKIIMKQIDQLKTLNIHQIGEIEKELDLLKEEENVEEWVQAVLNAAYAGNKHRYHELLNEL